MTISPFIITKAINERGGKLIEIGLNFLIVFIATWSGARFCIADKDAKARFGFINLRN